MGPTGTDTPDVKSDWLSIEVKHRRALPQWILDALDKARRGASQEQLGIVVLHECGRRGEGDLVVMTVGDFREWFDDAAALLGGCHASQE